MWSNSCEYSANFLGGASSEVELVKGETITLTTKTEFYEQCSKDMLYLDYINITKVVKPGNRVFVDDGLISLIANEIGESSTFTTASSPLLLMKLVRVALLTTYGG